MHMHAHAHNLMGLIRADRRCKSACALSRRQVQSTLADTGPWPRSQLARTHAFCTPSLQTLFLVAMATRFWTSWKVGAPLRSDGRTPDTRVRKSVTFSCGATKVSITVSPARTGIGTGRSKHTHTSHGDKGERGGWRGAGERRLQKWRGRVRDASTSPSQSRWSRKYEQSHPAIVFAQGSLDTV